MLKIKKRFTNRDRELDRTDKQTNRHTDKQTRKKTNRNFIQIHRQTQTYDNQTH